MGALYVVSVQSLQPSVLWLPWKVNRFIMSGCADWLRTPKGLVEAEDKYAPAVSGGLLSVLVTLEPPKIGRVGAIHVCAHVCTCEDRSPSSTPHNRYCYLRSQIPHQLFGEAYPDPVGYVQSS